MHNNELDFMLEESRMEFQEDENGYLYLENRVLGYLNNPDGLEDLGDVLNDMVGYISRYFLTSFYSQGLKELPV